MAWTHWDSELKQSFFFPLSPSAVLFSHLAWQQMNVLESVIVAQKLLSQICFSDTVFFTTYYSDRVGVNLSHGFEERASGLSNSRSRTEAVWCNDLHESLPACPFWLSHLNHKCESLKETEGRKVVGRHLQWQLAFCLSWLLWGKNVCRCWRGALASDWSFIFIL